MKNRRGHGVRIRVRAGWHSARARLVRLVGRRSKQLQRFACTDFDRETLVAAKRASVSVGVLTKNCAATIERTVHVCRELERAEFDGRTSDRHRFDASEHAALRRGFAFTSGRTPALRCVRERNS